VQAFEEFGGVPGRIRYDNLKTAVVKVLQGRNRLESERFVALRCTTVRVVFCRPGLIGAHEKAAWRERSDGSAGVGWCRCPGCRRWPS